MNEIHRKLDALKAMTRRGSVTANRPESCGAAQFRRLRGLPMIGFLSVSYSRIGGTETFHRSLLPRLKHVRNIAGFVAVDSGGGDGTLLGVPYAEGRLAAQELAANVDILVTWGVSDLQQILPTIRPRVVSVHHSDVSSGWSNDLTQLQIDVIDSIVCVNEHAAAHLKTTGKPVRHIPNAIDPERIRPSSPRVDLRRDFGISTNAKVLLFGHRMSAEKRPLLACQIAHELPDGWVLVCVGDGAESEAVKDAAASSSRIVYAGAADSLADWLHTSDCFLSLSTYEGFGLAVGDAMLLGVPTVSTPTGIAPGLAITLPIDASPASWAKAIVESDSWRPPVDLADRFSVQRMVAAWSDVLTT